MKLDSQTIKSYEAKVREMIDHALLREEVKDKAKALGLASELIQSAAALLAALRADNADNARECVSTAAWRLERASGEAGASLRTEFCHLYQMMGFLQDEVEILAEAEDEAYIEEVARWHEEELGRKADADLGLAEMWGEQLSQGF